MKKDTILREKYSIIDFEKKINSKIVSSIDNAYKINKKFFFREPPHFNVILCHSEKVFKREMKYRYISWAKGARLRNNNIVIRAPRELILNYKKHGGTKSFDKVLIHEMNHVFATHNFMKKGPLWLFEGLATYVADQKPTKGKIILRKDLFFYRFIHKKLSPEMYLACFLFTQYLIKKYGMRKLKSLIKSINLNTNKKIFMSNFKKLYGKSFNLILKDFLAL